MTFKDRQLTSMTFEAPPPSQTLNRNTNVLDYGRVGFNQWRIQRGGGGGRLPPLLLDQTEARRAEKMFLRPAPPPYLRV